MHPRLRSLTVAGTLLLATACAAPTPAEAPIGARAMVLVPDTTGMTFLVADLPNASPRQRAAVTALRTAMASADYRVALDPSDSYDVEVFVRVDVTSSDLASSDAERRELAAALGPGSFSDALRCTLTAVSHSIVLATSSATFPSKGDRIAPSDLTPALNKLGAAPRLTALAASIRHVTRATASTL